MSAGAPATNGTAETSGSADAAFQAWADSYYWAHLAYRPQLAIELGHHQFDGKIPPRAKADINAEIDRLRSAQTELAAVDVSALSPESALDRDVIAAEIAKNLFELVDLRKPFRDPTYYLLFDFSLASYIDRAYAPVEDRARGLLAACRQSPVYYGQMLENLDPVLPRPALQVSLFMVAGVAKLIAGPVTAFAAEVADPQLRGELSSCLTSMAATLAGVETSLKARLPSASPEFALGPELFLRMLRETQGIDLDLATLTALGRADLERNLTALTEAAREIDPQQTPAAVIALVTEDKPPPDKLFAEAQGQLERMRQFVVEHQIASIPTDDVAEVRPSPPHRRGNFAMLSSPGPFERVPLPAFYYLAPPEPTWTAAEQRAYLPSRADLAFVSIHEVWPGHFLQGRHIQTYGTRYMKSFETYTTSEGWAHCVEEMMWDAGYGKGDPRQHIGQLKNALLRNVRFLVAIGMHTDEMTVEEAATMFRDKAYADGKNAEQQALRGTIDPMYLSYTLGKLAIRKLRVDWERAQGTALPPAAFHDAFLKYGEAPLPVIRQRMLGTASGLLAD